MIDFAQWFDPFGPCRNRCGTSATGILMSHRNDKIGGFCRPCATKLIKQAHRKGDFFPDAALACTDPTP